MIQEIETPLPHALCNSTDAEPGPTVVLRSARRHIRHGGPGAPPRIGDIIENCRLIAELGQGSSGHAFLAEDVALAHRPLVLKITPTNHEEHLNLARLQHTQIMPLFWSSTLHREGLRVLAMPFLGRTTLASLLSSMEVSPLDRWHGQRVFEELQFDQEELPIRASTDANRAEELRKLTWVQFVMRMGQSLAEALAYAHRRHLLHLDVKPANILLTPDGQPVLLDLDVARQPIAAGATSVPWLGGTFAFMSPEQEGAMSALEQSQPVPQAVDARSDLYSLGLVLHQALGGKCDADRRPVPRELPRVNPRVDRELAEILARCLAEKPNDRYPDCAALAEELGRHLRDLPLKGVRTRWRERWAKWRRRRPLALPVIALTAAFCIACGVAGVNEFHTNDERRTQAEAALVEGQELLRNGQDDAAVSRLLAGKEVAQSAYGAGELHEQFARRLHVARRSQAADELHRAVHLMRFYALQEDAPRRLLHVLEASGRKVWQQRLLLRDRSAGKLELAVERLIDDELQESVLLWSQLQMRLAPATHTDVVRDDLCKVLDEAGQIFPSSLAVQLAKQQCLSAPPATMEPKTAWEMCAVGRARLAEDDVVGAARWFQKALERDPLAFVSNFHVGVAAMRQQRYADAVEAFSYCLGKEPTAECLVLRGEAFFALGDGERAFRDFTLAIERNSQLPIGYEKRASVFQARGCQAEAERDMATAHELRR